jgi:hypothetical protein
MCAPKLELDPAVPVGKVVSLIRAVNDAAESPGSVGFGVTDDPPEPTVYDVRFVAFNAMLCAVANAVFVAPMVKRLMRMVLPAAPVIVDNAIAAPAT